MTYRDFEIEITSRDAEHFEVEIHFDGMDETLERRFVVRLPPSYIDLIPAVDERSAEEMRNWRRAPDAGQPDELPFLIARMDRLRDYGERLFKTVLPPRLEQALGQLLVMGGMEGGVRIRLDLERAPALARVPWERCSVGPPTSGTASASGLLCCVASVWAATRLRQSR